MPGSGLWLRAFVGLLVGILPPLIVVLAVLMLGSAALDDVDPGLIAIGVVAGVVAWSAILAVLFGRSLGDEFNDLLSLARGADPGTPGEASRAYQQMASLLDERNRQVATLAQRAALVPIDEAPVRVAGSLVTTVASVMGDATWRCAVLASEDAELVPPGVYHGLGDSVAADPVGELERWASTAGDEAAARHVEGPWGAFTVVNVAMAGETRAILYAPWQGRQPPTRAELDLLMLVGQHAGTALEHSILYARVRSQADELNRMAAVQADFLRGVTHDLQTPLTSIGALATELKADAAVPEAARSDLDTITHQADRLRRMVSQLLVASRLEAGVFTPQSEVFAVPPIVERTWAALRADRPFELGVTGSPQLAVGDPDRLEQVLWAVLDNAVKYSPAGSRIGASVDASSPGQLAITITDAGPGMDNSTRSHAFEQFYRSDQARRMAPDGSGVGLYAARGLMEAMGGSIDVASELGSGTTITVRIPAEPSEGE
jgi:signal transduction histidine kinase